MEKYSVSRLCSAGEKVIESEVFDDLHYLVKNNHIILLSKRHGQFVVKTDAVKELFDEIGEILSVWGNIKANNCCMGG